MVGELHNGTQGEREVEDVVDFTNVNNAYLKNTYPFRNIDAFVDNTSGTKSLVSWMPTLGTTR